MGRTRDQKVRMALTTVAVCGAMTASVFAGAVFFGGSSDSAVAKGSSTTITNLKRDPTLPEVGKVNELLNGAPELADSLEQLKPKLDEFVKLKEKLDELVEEHDKTVARLKEVRAELEKVAGLPQERLKKLQEAINSFKRRGYLF
jgi:hypothetical protein